MTITKLTKATTKYRSLRTTVPIGIIDQFELKEGDFLIWKIVAKNGELLIQIEPKKS